MVFFRDRTVNLLNLHYGIQSIALSGGGAFFAVYLIEAGVSVAWALASLALILAGRFIIRPIVVPIAVRTGTRALVIAGTCLSALQYPLLAEVHGLGPSLFALCVVASLGDTFYWSTYHAYFAALGNHETRGAEIGVREAIAAVVGIASPLATGWALVAFGPRVAFGMSAAVMLLAALPLFWTPDVMVAASCPRRVPGGHSGHEAVPGGWLDWRGLSFRLANRALSFARRKLRRLWRGARSCRTCRRRRGPSARPAYRCWTSNWRCFFTSTRYSCVLYLLTASRAFSSVANSRFAPGLASSPEGRHRHRQPTLTALQQQTCVNENVCKSVHDSPHLLVNQAWYSVSWLSGIPAWPVTSPKSVFIVAAPRQKCVRGVCSVAVTARVLSTFARLRATWFNPLPQAS